MKNQIILLVICIVLICGCSFEDKMNSTFVRQGIIKDIQYLPAMKGMLSYTKTILIFTDGTRLILNDEYTPPTGKLIDIYYFERNRYWNKDKFFSHIEFLEGNYAFVHSLRKRPEGMNIEYVGGYK